MGLRRSLDDYKQNEDATDVFPGERRTRQGRFSGSDQRLVHVSPAGSLRDYSYPLSGFGGIVSSRFGVRVGDAVEWFDALDTGSQTYRAGRSLVETTHRLDGFDVVQRDVTDGLAHTTAFELGDGAPEDIELAGFVEISPEGRDGRVGQLVHDDAVEVYHNREHDYLGTSTEFVECTPQVLERFDEILAAESRSFPEFGASEEYEESRLTGGVGVRVAFEDGETSLVTLLSDIETQSRSDALSAVATRTRRPNSDSASLLATARQAGQYPTVTDRLVATDLSVLELLSAPTGARIAGPDFDPYYQYSGGYGYTWFRDDGEVSTFLLEADEALGFGAAEAHRQSAEFYLRTQLPDGRWPHRVWPMNGRLAPGWANGHIEGTETQYQADQTASVLVFLAGYLSTYRQSLRNVTVEAIESALQSGVDGLDSSLEDDGFPTVCENAWENTNGRFTHTAAKFVQAYSTIAAVTCDATTRERAATRATQVFDALDMAWVPDEGIYALRLDDGDGDLDDRVDSTTFSLVDAYLAYRAIEDIGDTRLRRLERHLHTAFSRLWKETGDISGLTRFEGDTWRQRGQGSEKIWTVSTGWGAYAAEKSIRLFSSTDEYDPEKWADRLFDEIDLNGSLCLPSGYLPEQFFDTGAPDSATPLGWSHAIRLATHASRVTRGTCTE
ncbi:glycoside hydrolase family 15 protein [Haloferax sp. ATB1]|uniref:glycoside hydrolase family 15 protein n=1 Tax=Haloferax sp. ATB1 TaxID=1508454 RepID=UPI0005B2202B|nr:glycoside hydrolase family 15 protein [Haloferax sp. ATB1]